MGNKTFLVGVLVGGRGEKKIGRARVFSPQAYQNVLSKMERKLSGRNLIDK